MKKILAMTWKDLKIFLKDRGGIVLIFVQPFMFILESLPLLHPDVRMVFPEATLDGQGAFSEWLAGVVRLFFDERHIVKEVTADIVSPDTANVKVVVNWQTKRWKPPAASSEFLDCMAYQSWVVKACPDTGRPLIATYVVDRLVPQPGSAPL